MLMFVVLALSAIATGAVSAPVLVPDAAVMRLDDIASYEIGYVLRGKPEKQFPLGWSGDFEASTGVACKSAGVVAGKHAWLLHCPWSHGTGVSFQQYTFRMPKVRSIRLGGFTAMGPDAVGKSDGATFRIFANGRKLLDVNRADSNWQPFSIDLTSFSGRTVTIRFETDPGPMDNSGWDFSLWGDRELVLEGYHPKRVRHPDPPRLDLSKMLSKRFTVAPPCGFAARTSARIVGDKAVLTYLGADGSLEYTWARPNSFDAASLGKIVLRAHMKGDAAVQTCLGGSNVEWIGQAKLTAARWLRGSDSVTLVREFEVGGQPATISVAARLAGKSLVFDVKCNRPFVASFDAGRWLPAMRRAAVPAPYYSGQVSYLPTENLFVNAFLDWTSSDASSIDGGRAIYRPLTDGSHNNLRERAIYTAAWHFAEALPSIPNPPSPYLRQVGDKVTLDVWSGTFDQIAMKLQALHDLGLDHCIALIHNWQRRGYDNALPMHYPANPGLGADDSMKRLVATAKGLGYLIALHENYVDYYPNFDGFNPDDISLTPEGKPENAWYNPGTKIQSFAEKPNSILKYAAEQSTEISHRYGTNANYLDVHSAVPPWFHVDFRAGEQGAGTFARVWDVHRELWAFERKTFDGPVFGEGNNHWYWSGLLDGVEAQTGSGWPWQQGDTLPLAVDFDLLRIHPLQCNQGMGYYERWTTSVGWGAAPRMDQLDQYRMQEMAYGHAGFLGSTTWSSEPIAWLEHHLTTPVSARFADARPVSIRYQVNGKWVDGTAAAKARDWSRVEVRYSNGLTVTANNSGAPMIVDGRVLPKHGWLARGAGVTAYTAQQDGKLIDYAEADSSIFANARNVLDWNVNGPRRIGPRLEQFTQTGPREFEATYLWSVDDKLAKDYQCFVHFDDPSKPEADRIRFQQDHTLATPTSHWMPGSTVTDGPHTIKLPDDLADGDYTWSIGLFLPNEGRLALSGVDDGGNRIRLGVLKVRDGGQTLTLEPESGQDERAELARQAMNDLTGPIDFGPIRTDGSVLVRREGDYWVLRAWPRQAGRVVELSAQRFPMPTEIACVDGTRAIVKPETVGSFWRLPLDGAKEYRWKAR